MPSQSQYLAESDVSRAQFIAAGEALLAENARQNALRQQYLFQQQLIQSYQQQSNAYNNDIAWELRGINHSIQNLQYFNQ